MTKEFVFKVNGDEFHTDQQFLTALEILTIAKEKGAVPSKPEDYILQGDKGKYEGSARVDLEQDNVFVTIPNRSTPVA